MSIEAGVYKLGPDHGRLTVRTERTGAAAKAGHNLLIEVTAWEATLTVGDDTNMELTADPSSLRVREGSGGMQTLGDGDKDEIAKTIHAEVLKGHPIAFRSTRVEAAGDALDVSGELTIFGATRPITFELTADGEGQLTAAAVVKQSDFGVKPYSTLFGALKVVDEVRVELDAGLPQSR